jgi:hypothetical protein
MEQRFGAPNGIISKGKKSRFSIPHVARVSQFPVESGQARVAGHLDDFAYLEPGDSDQT